MIVPRRRLTAERLSEALDDVLKSPEVANRCAHLRSKMNGETPIQHAAHRIAAFAEH